MAVYLSLALIFLASWLNAEQTYILSYRSQIKNSLVISESYQLSEAMSEVKAKKAQSLSVYSSKERDLNKILLNNKDKILEFLMKYGVHTLSYEKIRDLKSSSLIVLTLPPTYITVDFNDDYATITRLILE